MGCSTRKRQGVHPSQSGEVFSGRSIPIVHSSILNNIILDYVVPDELNGGGGGGVGALDGRAQARESTRRGANSAATAGTERTCFQPHITPTALTISLKALLDRESVPSSAFRFSKALLLEGSTASVCIMQFELAGWRAYKSSAENSTL